MSTGVITLTEQDLLRDLNANLSKIAGDLASHRAVTETRLEALVDQLTRQNGRVGKLEDRAGQLEQRQAEERGRLGMEKALWGFAGALFVAMVAVVVRFILGGK